MKKRLFILSLVFAMSVSANVMAETAAEDEPAVEAAETTAETEEAAETEDTAAEEAPAGSSFSADNLFWGRWYGVGQIGESDYTTYGELNITPDGMITGEEWSAPYEVTDETHLGFPGQEGMTITMEYGTLTQEELDSYGVKHMDFAVDAVGSPRIILTVSLIDPKNPLATYEVSGSTLFVRMTRQSNYIKNILRGKNWKIGANMLAIDDELNMSLNDGANTGRIYVSEPESIITIEFYWEGTPRITYHVGNVTENTITLINAEREDDVLTLENVSEPGAAGAAAEPAAEAVEDAAETEAEGTGE